MKVLIINTTNTKANGITNVIFNLFHPTKSLGHEIDFLTVNDPPKLYTDIIENNGGRVYTLSRSVSHPLRYIRTLKKLLRGYDAVHVHGNSASMLLEMIAARAARVSVRILHSHSTSTNNPLLHSILRPFLRFFSTARLACSNESGKWTYGCDDYVVINNTIDVKKYVYSPEKRSSLRLEYNIDDKTSVYGHVGAFNPEKNHGFLVDVFYEIQKREPDSRLFLIGDGRLRDTIQSKVNDLGISDKVIFVGNITNVFDFLNLFDVFIFPSLHEGFGIAPLEAQANGMAVVAAKDNVPDVVRILDNFVFLPVSDGAEKWAEGILTLNTDRVPAAQQAVISAGYDTDASVEVIKKVYSNEQRRL